MYCVVLHGFELCRSGIMEEEMFLQQAVLIHLHPEMKLGHVSQHHVNITRYMFHSIV